MILSSRLSLLTLGLVVLLAATAIVSSGCGSAHSVTDQRAYGAQPGSTATTDRQAATANPPDSGKSDQPTDTTSTEPATTDEVTATPDSSATPESESGTKLTKLQARLKEIEANAANSSDVDQFIASVDNGDSASAVDDDIWRLFELAEEYHGMGVLANREASWEEAQYYFEKSLKILATLDIDESDTLISPESVKYSTILDNVVSDYRITLRSLGKLEEDVAPSVLVERFGSLEKNLESDTIAISRGEYQPVTYDLPIVMNERVKKSIVYFQTTAHDAFERYLSRSNRYNDMFREILTEHDMPHDLVYLSLVESGYNAHAYSWARAMGLWQFISSTGRLYGLKRDWWIDERKDPVKATHAAARFLKDLYKQFGDWELAMAAYNGGPGRVSKTIKRQGTRDFWKLNLRRQTMDYVPLIYAAAIIAKNPEKYGFTNIAFEDQVVWDEVEIDRCLDLKEVSKRIGCSLEELKWLNPELLRNYTPPNVKSYSLKLPPHKKQTFLAEYDNMPSPKETSWVKHTIDRGETISTIAAKYGVSQYAIFNANDLNSKSKIYAGKQLIVPVPMDRDYSSSASNSNRAYEAEGSIYTVRAGDTMWDIAKAFGTSVEALRRINYIERGSRIYVGQKMKIPSDASMLAQKNSSRSKRTLAAGSSNSGNSNSSGSSSAPVISSSSSTYKVKAGDTLWDIARMFGTTTTQIRQLNSLGRSSRIFPGQVLTVSGNSADYVIYKVRRGDTLSKIAQRHRTTISRILALNGLTDPDNIGVGDQLKIQTR